MKKIIGLLGFPLHHSWSPDLYQRMFLEYGLKNFNYQLCPLERLEDFPALLTALPDICGLNVTIPFKESILPYLDAIDPIAAEIGAVNTIRIEGTVDGRTLTGYNTDADGFLFSSDFSGHQSALILGTGGASKAVSYALKRLGIAPTLVSRSGALKNALSFDELDDQVMDLHTLIINATPVGMYPNSTSSPPIPYHLLTSRHFLYDLVYNPEETLFLKQGKREGTKIQSGFRMLSKQAELTLNLFLDH